MRERQVPRPLPEGNHGQLPEGSRGDPKPIARLQEKAKAVFENDPDLQVVKTGVKAFKLSSGSMLILEAGFITTDAEGEHSQRIASYKRSPDGDIKPIETISLSDDGDLIRDRTAAVTDQISRTLDEFEQENGLREIDPISGEEIPSARRKEVEASILDQIYSMTGVDAELEINLLNDEEAVSFLRTFQITSPTGEESLSLPSNPEKGQPQAQTVEAFKVFTASLANQEVQRISSWSQGNTTIILSAKDIIAADGAELPYEVGLEKVVHKDSEGAKVMHKTIWNAQRATFRTGSVDRVIISPQGESNTLEIRDINRAARDAHEAHMASPESDASPEDLSEALDIIDRRAESLLQMGKQEENVEDEATVLQDIYNYMKEAGFIKDIPEPPIGEYTDRTIEDQENDGDNGTPGKDIGNGKSK